LAGFVDGGDDGATADRSTSRHYFRHSFLHMTSCSHSLCSDKIKIHFDSNFEFGQLVQNPAESMPPRLHRLILIHLVANLNNNPIMSIRDRVCHFKLVLLGDTAVGKSCLVVRFVRDEFFEFQEPTIGGEMENLAAVVHDA
jgi:hypothetical protein